MNIQVADVIKVAYELKISLTAHKVAYVIANYDNKAEDDPTGALDLWIEQLLWECEDHHHVDFVNNQINELFEGIKSEFAVSENTSGEFIIGFEIPVHWDGYDLSSYVVSQAIYKFLEWDESPQTVGIKVDGDNWVTYEINGVEYDGKNYPLRIFTVTIDEHNDGWEHTYAIAPESLLDAIEKDNDEDDREFTNIDNIVYHYVQDEYFFEDAKYVCKDQLDLPMTLIEENV